MMTYSTGVITRLRNVETSMPPNTTVPSECRAALPAPLAKTSGMTAMMKAIEVIRIGRKPRLSRAQRRRDDVGARANLLVGELDDQNRALTRQADQHDVADLRVDVLREAGIEEKRESGCGGSS